MQASEDHPENVKLELKENLREKPRWCTDIIFLLLILYCWIAMTVIGWEAIGIFKSDGIPQGNPQRLVHSLDYNGKFCGVDDGVSDLRYAYYLADGAVVCVEKCPNYNDYKKFICKYDRQSDADNSITTGYQYVLQLSCMYQIKTRSLLYRCIPDTDTHFASMAAEATANSYGVQNVTAVYSETSTRNNGWFSNFLGDLMQVRAYVFGFGIGLTVGFAILYLYFLRIPYLLTLIIWSVAFGIFILLILSSFLLWSLAKRWSRDGIHSPPEVLTMYTFAYIGMAITALYFCLMVVMRKRIQLAIGIVKETARAFTVMPTVILLPILQTIGLVCFLVPWFIYVLYLASSGEKVVQQGSVWLGGKTVSYSYATYSYATNTKYAFVYMLFCWFWTSEFILALGQLILALSFAAWYFTRDKSQVGNHTVSWAIRTACWYHSGTVAFGALIITIVKMIRAMVLYLEKQMKQSTCCNGILQYISCMINCFLRCVEHILRYINTNAYILTAIGGYSFCTSSKKAFFLLLRNILRVSAVHIVSSLVLSLGLVFVPLATTFFCYLGLAYSLDSAKVSGIIAPLVFTFFLSYWVTSMFMEIFGMGMETILLCFIADEEMYPIDNRFAGKALTGVIIESERKREALQVAVPIEYSRYAGKLDAETTQYKKVNVMDQLTMQDDAVDTTIIQES